MEFLVKVYENAHYADESAAYNQGFYETYEVALDKAKAIVMDFLEHHWKPGISTDQLLDLYYMFGEDPVIVPDTAENHFSARIYAKEMACIICARSI